MELYARTLRWRRALLDLVWPAQCPICEGWLPPAPADCAGPGGGPNLGLVHRSCMESLPRRGGDPPLPGTRAEGCPISWHFQDDARFFRLLHAVKYGGQYPLMEALSESFAQWAAPVLARIGSARIVPLPDDPVRRAQRGYSLPEVLAIRLSANGNLPLARGILTRRKATRSLATLPLEEDRAAALRSVFQVSRLAELPEGVPLILVDDQVTTGATLRACVPLLRSRDHPLLALALAGAAAAPQRV